jgi:hypothetical protein
VDGDVALVEVRDHGLRQRPRALGEADQLSVATGSSEISIVTEAPCGS